MYCDCFFHMGFAHEICEDYALACQDFVTISDGCSNGGGPSLDSDWGSRLICAAQKENKDLLADNPMDFIWDSFHLAKNWVSSMRKNPKCLTATSLSLLKTQSKINGLVVGDGVIGGIKKDNTWEIHTYEFLNGGSLNASAPFYPSYLYDEFGEFNTYKEKFGNQCLRKTYRGNLFGELIEEQNVIIIENKEDALFTHDFPIDEFQYAFIGSDGWFSFLNKNKTETSIFNEPVSTIEALKVILDKPMPHPQFLRRQRNWAFQRATSGTFLNKKWSNYDDVSMAGIWI